MLYDDLRDVPVSRHAICVSGEATPRFGAPLVRIEMHFLSPLLRGALFFVEALSPKVHRHFHFAVAEHAILRRLWSTSGARFFPQHRQNMVANAQQDVQHLLEGSARQCNVPWRCAHFVEPVDV